MRIVAGKHKGRILAAPKGRDTRPTSDRTRGAVFNILEHGIEGLFLRDVHVLDVFAGTGALGLEALSRGAATATFIEQSSEALKCLSENIRTLKTDDQATVIKTDATRPPPAKQSYDLVFLDPPYGKDLVTKALTALQAKSWISSGAFIVAEVGSKEETTLPEAFGLLDERVYGAAKIVIAQVL